MNQPSDDPESEQHEPGGDSGSPIAGEALMKRESEPSAELAAERISAWYEVLGPRLGAYLTNPNVVLTLAGARGFTEFGTLDFNEDDIAAFAHLNQITLPQGIYFEARTVEDKGTTSTFVDVINLPGLEYTASRTKLPGVPRFRQTDPNETMKQWYEAAVHGVELERERGQYPPDTGSRSSNAKVVASGVMRGYPDTAIMSVLGGTDSQRTSVPYAGYYDCEEPNYSFDPQHSEGVAEHVSAWGNLLENYYRSSSHAKLSSTAEFKSARKDADRS